MTEIIYVHNVLMYSRKTGNLEAVGGPKQRRAGDARVRGLLCVKMPNGYPLSKK